MAGGRRTTRLIGLRASVTVDSLQLFTAHTGQQEVPPTCQYRGTLPQGTTIISLIAVPSIY